MVDARRWLILGAGGLVGSNCMQVLQEAKANVEGTTRDGSGATIALPDLADARAVADVIGTTQPGVVVIAAGSTAVDRCEGEPDWARAGNVATVANVVEALAPETLLVHISTDYVFDGLAGPYDESAVPAPISVYGRTKREGELVAETHPRWLIARTTVVYGKEPEGRGRNSLYQLANSLGEGRTFRAAEDEIGTPTAARDLAEFIRDLVAVDATGLFHIGGADLISRVEYARTAATVLGLDPDLIVPVSSASMERAAPRPLRHGLISDAAASLVGRATSTVVDGIRQAREELGW